MLADGAAERLTSFEKAVSTAQDNYKAQRKLLSDAKRRLKAAGNHFAKVNEAFGKNPGNANKLAALRKATQDLGGADTAVQQLTESTNRANETLKEHKKALADAKKSLMAELRKQAVANIDDRNSVETQLANQYDTEMAKEANDFVDKYFPGVTDQEQKAALAEKYRTTKANSNRYKTQVISQFATKLSKRFGLTFNFVDSHGLFNGFVAPDGSITLNTGASTLDAVKLTIGHEFGHIAQKTGFYADMKDLAVKFFFGNDLQAYRDAVAQRKANYEQTLG